MFKGLYPLYSRHIIKDKHDKMEIRYTQINYTHSREIDYILHGINNYKIYYYNKHPRIPISEIKEKAKLL